MFEARQQNRRRIELVMADSYDKHVARRSKALRPNENGRSVLPVLGRVDRLRRAYSDATSENMAASDDAVRELIALLSEPATALVIDAELARRRPWAELTEVFRDRELVKREAELARSFGFKPREVKRYIKRARDAGAAPPVADIGSVAELLELIKAVHADLREALPAEGWPWKTWLPARRARAEADARVFAIGAIVADTMRRPLFDLSYAVGVTGLRRRAA